MIADLLVITLPAFTLGAVLMALGNRRVGRDDRHARWLKFSVFFAIVHGVLFAAAGGTPWISGVVVLIVVCGVPELARAWHRIPGHPLAIWAVYGAVGGLAIANTFALPPAWIAFLFLVAASFDGFGQVVGQWAGRTPLAPRISPAKTVEGALGGMIAALVVALAVRAVPGVDVPGALMWGAATAIAALAGDLSKSWVKRRAGIKDFGRALPGQGGFLDRFDSFLAACALVGLLLRF